MARPGKMIREIMGTLFKKPATTKYPNAESVNPEGVRGMLVFHADMCIGCKLCMKDCPAGALKITKTGEKSFEAEIDLGRCIFCGQCVDSCLKKALESTDRFELAELDEKKLRVMLGEKPEKGPKKGP